MNNVKPATNNISGKTVAIIPARGGSQGIPGKNIIDFCGKPLIFWTILQAMESKCIDEVYVTTDDDEIARISSEFGAKIIERPDELAGDSSSSEEALQHAVDKIGENVDIDTIVFLQATSPVRDKSDIDNAVKSFHDTNSDSVFSASLADDLCVWRKNNGDMESVTFDYKDRRPRQEKEMYYLENGSIYVFKPGLLRSNNNRIGGKVGMYLMPSWRSYEIDKPEDIEICEYFMNKLLK